MRLLNQGSEGKNVVNSMMCWVEPCLTSGSKISLFKVPGKLHMKNCSIEFQERVAYHDRSVVVSLRSGYRLVNQMDDMVRLDRW